MNFLTVADKFIPGYSFLSGEDRETFQNSPIGQSFSTAVNKTEKSLTSFQNSASWWRQIFGNMDEELNQLKQEFEVTKASLMAQLESSDEYNTLVTQIVFLLLPQACPDFSLLSPEEQYNLAQQPFSQDLRLLISLDQLIDQAEDEYTSMDSWQQIQRAGWHKEKVEMVDQEKAEVIKNWQEKFATLEEVKSLRQTIEVHKQKEWAREIEIQLQRLYLRAEQLSHFFVWLESEPNAIAELQEQYRKTIVKGTVSFGAVEENELTHLIFHYLQQATQSRFDYITLHHFNLEQATLLAHDVLEAFNRGNDLQIDEWFAEYQRKLTAKLHNNLLLINNKKWEIPEQSQQELLGSLASLFWQNKTVEKTKEFINKLADAHAFIQATGFSTQNESSFLAILDIYNYGRAADQITETRAVLSSLFKPFLPLWEEYRDIALYEKNVYLKILRTAMPLIVVAAFVILVAALLAPLAIPELAFTVVLIPTLFIGLALATKYVAIKDNLYKSLRESYYGGAFEIPEFQVNQRMVTIFKTEGNASVIRDFYIKELKRCDEIELAYQLGAQNGVLRQEEIEDRKANQLKRHTLCLEWYDIHSNSNLGYEQVPQLVLARLKETSNREYDALKMALQQDFPSVQNVVKDTVRHLKATLASQQNTITENSAVAQNPTTAIATNQENYSPRLFKPHKSLARKEQVETLDAITTAIRVGL